MTIFVVTAAVALLLLCDRDGHRWLQPRCTAAVARVVDKGCAGPVARPIPLRLTSLKRSEAGARTSTRRPTARAATWRTASRSASPTCSRTAPRRHHAGQSAPPVVCIDGLRAALRACAASGCRHTQFADGDLRHHPAEAPEARCAGDDQRPAHQDRDGVSVSLPGRVRARPRPIGQRHRLIRTTETGSRREE